MAFLIVQQADLDYQKRYLPLIKEAAAKKMDMPERRRLEINGNQRNA